MKIFKGYKDLKYTKKFCRFTRSLPPIFAENLYYYGLKKANQNKFCFYRPNLYFQ